MAPTSSSSPPPKAEKSTVRLTPAQLIGVSVTGLLVVLVCGVYGGCRARMWIAERRIRWELRGEIAMGEFGDVIERSRSVDLRIGDVTLFDVPQRCRGSMDAESEV